MTKILDFERSIVRIYFQSNQVKGAGFLVSENQVMTCAHVVALALGINGNTAEMPTTEVKLDFPQVAPGKFLTAKIIFWLPVNPQVALEDIAVLELTTIPNNISPVRLMTSEEYWGHNFRAFGFPMDKEYGVWANGVLRSGTANGWVQLEDIDNTGYALQEGFSGTPVWDESLEGVVGMAVAADKQRPDAKAAFIIPTNILMKAWPQLEERLIAGCPYKGLFAFGEGDAEYFFGREAIAEQLVAAVARQQFVAVIGPSGSGKSSVVFAGLVPKLRSQGNWQIEQFRPKAHPFDELARVLIRLKQPGKQETGQDIEALQLSSILESKESTLSTWLSSILEKHPGSRLLLVADQFEEIYTLCTDKEKRVLFLERLLNAVANIPDLTLVITLRADFLGSALSDRSLADALQGIPPNPPLKGGGKKSVTWEGGSKKTIPPNPPLKGGSKKTIPPNPPLKGVGKREGGSKSNRNVTYFLGPMNSQELRSVIEMPAQKLGVRLEAGLTERILKDVERSPGNLPLLEFALERLWGKQSNSQLTHEGYEEVGGVEKALASYADDIYEKLSEADREMAERVFIQLVQPGMGTEDTRKVATRADVGADNWDLVRRLADARLVVTGRDETGEETVEVIHEALIREWGMLRGWMAVSREFRVWQEKLKGRLAEWEDKDKDNGALLRGLVLAEAEKWQQERLSELSREERVFIRLSLELRDREEEEKERQQKEKVKLQRRAIQWLSGGLTMAVIAVGVAGWQWRRAEIGEKNAEMRVEIANLRARFASTQSLDIMLEGIQIVKELKSDRVKLLKLDTRIQGIDMLRQMVYWQGFKEHNTLEHLGAVKNVAFSPKEDLIATISEEKVVKLWGRDGQLVTIISDNRIPINDFSFSPTGNVIATISDNKTAKLWTTKGKFLNALSGDSDKVNTVVFSPKGDMIATASDDNTVKLWTTEGKLLNTLFEHSDKVNTIVFNPKGEMIATASDDNTVKLWTTEGKLLNTLSEHNDRVNTVIFSPKGDLIATIGDNKIAKLWDINGSPAQTISQVLKKVDHVTFNHKQPLMATVTDNNTVQIWKLDGTLVTTFRGHSDEISSIIFSPDGEMIATASRDNTIRLSKLDGTFVDTLEGHTSPINSFTFSPKGELIASASDDGTVKFWKRNTLRDTIPGNCRRAAFSPNEKLIALGCYDQTFKILTTEDFSRTTIKQDDNILSIAFSINGDMIVTGSNDGKVKLWEPNGNLIRVLANYQHPVYSVAFNANSDLIAASHNNKVDLWRPNGELVQILPGHGLQVLAIAFIPREDRDFIATTGADRKLKIWKTDGTLINNNEKHGKWVYDLAVSPNGNLIASGSIDKKVQLWGSDGFPLNTLFGHSGTVLGVAFNYNGSLIATASQDKTVRLWKPDGTPLHILREHNHQVEYVAFSPRSNLMVTLSDDGTVKLWNFNIDDLLQHSCDWVRDYLKNNPNVTEEDRDICDDID
ncbi:MAG: trypsin-like serine protease [Okeania sp. SIO3I5]|uniref:nSTAND1 domain-containing NTPase n=1 Tax=Okeania sp. SIO3I5 TaxID=2607805 RepID=UPI0013BCCD5C|nr:trypsin-like peptidase domain-containing protein [Okeania sp. SIO3I5]NEQ36637.1 trypsin-like serine protease [Okeania sp. SIO3I5]